MNLNQRPPVFMRSPFHMTREASDSGETEQEPAKLTPEFIWRVVNRYWEVQSQTNLQTAYDHLDEQEYAEYLADRRMGL
jgi:hypothetical protein